MTAAAGTELSTAKRLLLEKMLRGERMAAVPGGGSGADAVPPRAPGVAPPLAAEQRQVWLHAAMVPDLPLYNEPVTIRRRGPFDLAVLEESFNEVLRRHEIWRTSFAAVDADAAAVVQVVHSDLRVRLPLVDLTGLPEAEREAAASRLATDEARRPFDLGAAPLFRARVLKLAEDDHRLYLTLHHLVFDGVSLCRVMLPELAAIYGALADGRGPTAAVLAEPALQYGDYAIWREGHAAGEAVRRQMDHWRRELAGELPLLQLPCDRARPPCLTYRGSMETFALAADLVRELKALGRCEGVTAYVTYLAAFKALLFRYDGQEDLVVGGVTDTRRRPELEHLMGYFLNSIVLRTRPSADLPFRRYLHQVRDAVLGALGASDVPFDEVVRELQPKRNPSRHPLFDAVFSIQPPLAALAVGWDLTQMDVTVGVAKFDLYLELEERPDALVGRFLYSTDLFEAATVQRLIRDWTALLAAVAADPETPLGSLPPLARGETPRMPDPVAERRPGTPPPARIVPPRDELERKLVGIWEDVLRVPAAAVGIHNDFFDLGGHSLLAARLLRRIATVFGRRLPMAAVFRAPTVASMAALLRDAGWAPSVPGVIEVQPSGSRPALFWLGAGPAFRPLAQALGADQPFLGVELDPTALGRPTRLADPASHLVRVIRAAQAEGPYYLGGYCTAGILAFEVASQLQAAGQEVGLLVLVHAMNPGHFRRIGAAAIEGRRFEHHFRELARRRGRARWGYAAARTHGALRRVARAAWRAVSPDPRVAFEVALDRAAIAYEPKPYRGDVVLFQPAERWALADCRPGWAEVIEGGFTALDVPGKHATVLEQPNVRELGAKLGTCLRRAQAEGRRWWPEAAE